MSDDRKHYDSSVVLCCVCLMLLTLIENSVKYSNTTLIMFDMSGNDIELHRVVVFPECNPVRCVTSCST